jgi:predicted branched-subunit amino acid permease
MKNDFVEGFVANIPIGISVAVFGSVCGMMSSQAGMRFYEMTLMNLFIFAGSSQLVMVQMWGEHLDVLGIILAALMMNLRYFLIGASLHSLFTGCSPKEKRMYMHLVADKNWAITMQKMKTKTISPLFLFGGGVCLVLIWSGSTSVGYLLGSFIADPNKYALDFAFISIFTALSFKMYQGKQSIFPWIIAAFTACLSEYLIPGKFYIVLGALVGSFSAALFYKGKK